MPSQQRLALLKAVSRSQPTGGDAEAFRVGELLTQLAPFTGQPAYAIPQGLLDRLPKDVPGWLSPAELQNEQRFTELCESHYSLGVYLGEFIDHPCFCQAEMVPITAEIYEAYLSSPHATLAEMQHSARTASGALDAVHERREAYLGWLLTCPQFLQERSALRQRWDETVQRLAVLRCSRSCDGNEAPTVTDADCQQMSNEFEQFCGRWHVCDMSTWDLPIPLGVNLGGPAILGRLAGLDRNPAAQLPPFLRMPQRRPVETFLQGDQGPHLDEWHQICDQHHPDNLSYGRLRMIMRLQVLRNIILQGAYGERFPENTERIDELFADFLGGVGEQSVRKLRQWIGRRYQQVDSAGDGGER